jgi:hypothetical protein
MERRRLTADWRRLQWRVDQGAHALGLPRPALKRTIKIDFFLATLKRCFPLLKQRAPTGFNKKSGA